MRASVHGQWKQNLLNNVYPSQVAVWMTPEMKGPQAARLVALHVRYHVGALGFSEEQARCVGPELARAVCKKHSRTATVRRPAVCGS